VARESTVIDGYLYEMSMLPSTPAYRLFWRLFKILGPSFGAVVDVVSSADDLQDVDLSSNSVVNGIKVLTDNVQESDLDYVIDQLRSVTHVGVAENTDKTIPLKGQFEKHFMGKFGSLLKWVHWGLKVQYQNFSDVFASMMPQSGDEPAQAANSQTP
jgi:hypothetical protein